MNLFKKKIPETEIPEEIILKTLKLLQKAGFIKITKDGCIKVTDGIIFNLTRLSSKEFYKKERKIVLLNYDMFLYLTSREKMFHFLQDLDEEKTKKQIFEKYSFITDYDLKILVKMKLIFSEKEWSAKPRRQVNYYLRIVDGVGLLPRLDF